MEFTIENIILISSVLLFASVLISKASFKFGLPALIIFLGVGMLAGADGLGGIYFDNPTITGFIGTIALNFILFSGGLDTRLTSVKPILGKGIVLATWGVLLTATAVGLFVHWITDFTLYESLLLGAVVSSTDAAAVFSILRTRSVNLKGSLRPLLEFESGSNDPMAYFLTVSLTFLVKHPETSVLSMIPLFLKGMILGGIIGFLAGKGMIWLVNKIKLSIEGLYPVLVIALMFIIFSATDAMGGNGFLAIYISAVILGNAPFAHKRSILRFYDGLAWLMQIVLFITLGLLVFPARIIPLMGVGFLIAAFLMLVARPISVFLSLSWFKVPVKEQVFISWVGLRGAVPIVFSIYPLTHGVEKADTIFNLVFFIAISSVLLQGTSLAWVAQKLGLTNPNTVPKNDPLDLELKEDSEKNILKTAVVEASGTVAGKQILSCKFPTGGLIVLIEREEQYITPRGSTELEVGDKLTIMADDKETVQQMLNMITGNISKPH